MKKIRLAVFSLAVAFDAVLPTQSQATVWDAASDFTLLTTANPNGVWSYGYDPASAVGYQFKAFNQFSAAVGSSIIWVDGSYVTLNTPSLYKNLSSSSVVGILPGQISLHPGPTSNGDAAILRFTAPATGSYGVNAQFFAGDTSETDARVVLNGNFNSALQFFGVTSTNPIFSAGALALAAGDTLDFVVGNAGSFFFDST